MIFLITPPLLQDPIDRLSTCDQYDATDHDEEMRSEKNATQNQWERNVDTSY